MSVVRTAKHLQELIVLNIRPLAGRGSPLYACVHICAQAHLHISGLSLRSTTPSLSTGGTAGLTDTTGALLPDQDRRKRRARGWGERSSCAGLRRRARTVPKGLGAVWRHRGSARHPRVRSAAAPRSPGPGEPRVPRAGTGPSPPVHSVPLAFHAGSDLVQ